METDGPSPSPPSPQASSAGVLPEVEAYAYLLVVAFLVDKGLYPEVCNILEYPFAVLPGMLLY